MTRRFEAWFGELPPSDNMIRTVGYRTIGRKKQATIVYTRDAINYKKALIRALNSTEWVNIQRFAQGDTDTTLYHLEIELFFPPSKIVTAGWLNITKKTGKRKAKSPYKKSDTLNRRKLIEDGLSEALGIDDSRFWVGTVSKSVSPEEAEGVFVTLTEVNPLDYGVPLEYLKETP